MMRAAALLEAVKSAERLKLSRLRVFNSDKPTVLRHVSELREGCLLRLIDGLTC
jgi:hypothetical protein